MMKRTLFLILAGMVCAVHAKPIVSWTLPNGARVLFVENHALPIVDVSVSMDAGVRRDPSGKLDQLGKSGVAAMTCALLSNGIAAVDGEPALNEGQFDDAVADIAAEIGCSADGDRAIIRLRTLSSAREREAATMLAARMLAQPAFPKNALTREKARSIAGIKEADTKPGSIADKTLWRAMYGKHPYAERPTVESVEQISRSDLASFHRSYYVSSHAVIAIVGSVTREQAEAMALQLTQRLPQARSDMTPLPDVSPSVTRDERQQHPASQAHILIGMPAMRRDDPDYFAISVGNYILGGGGFVSRLVHEVRETRGLAYSVRSSFHPMMQEGPFLISLQTKKEQSAEAVKVVRQTLAAFLRDGPTQKELQAAKDYMIGGFALNLDTNSKMLANVSAIGYYGLPLDYLDTWKQKVDKVTAENIRSAFKRKIDPARMVTVIVGAPE